MHLRLGGIVFRRLGTTLFAFFTVALIANGVSHAQPQSMLTRHVRVETLNGQARFVGSLSAIQPRRLTVVLPLRDQAGLREFLKNLYDPASPSYRKFLTVEEFTERFGPTQQDYDN